MIFDHFHTWYAKLLKWNYVDLGDREEVWKDLEAKSEAIFSELEALCPLGGRFQGYEVWRPDKDHLAYPKLEVQLSKPGGNGRQETITAIFYITVNPCFVFPENEKRRHHTKIWINAGNPSPEQMDMAQVAHYFGQCHELSEALAKRVSRVYIESIKGDYHKSDANFAIEARTASIDPDFVDSPEVQAVFEDQDGDDPRDTQPPSGGDGSPAPGPGSSPLVLTAEAWARLDRTEEELKNLDPEWQLVSDRRGETLSLVETGDHAAMISNVALLSASENRSRNLKESFIPTVLHLTYAV